MLTSRQHRFSRASPSLKSRPCKNTHRDRFCPFLRVSWGWKRTPKNREIDAFSSIFASLSEPKDTSRPCKNTHRDRFCPFLRVSWGWKRTPKSNVSFLAVPSPVYVYKCDFYDFTPTPRRDQTSPIPHHYGMWFPYPTPKHGKILKYTQILKSTRFW